MRFLACDFWSGSDAQCDLYQSLAQISFPVLLNALPLGAPDMFNCSYHYVIVVDGNGVVQFRGTANFPVLEVVLQAAIDRLPTEVGVGDVPGTATLLGANYPNPFNPLTRIPYEVPDSLESAGVVLDVVDMRGRVVRTLVSASLPAGPHVAVFDGRDAGGNPLPSGSYLARLRIGSAVASRIMTLVK